MLILFDLDGTLISSYMDEYNHVYDRWRVLPGRREQLAKLKALGHTFGIVTNQGGVGLGYVSEQQARRKLARALDALGLPAETPVAVCFAHANSNDPRYSAPADVARRKPSGAMIHEIIAAQSIAASDVLFVGDRPEDEAAAAAAAVPFVRADQFFH